MQESPKTINNILPEEVANGIFKMLGLDNRVGEKTIFIGEGFEGRSIDIVPTTPFHPQYKDMNINFRLDLKFDMTHFHAWAANCKLNILTKDPIPLSYLAPHRGRFFGIHCFLEGEFTKNDIKEMRKSSAPLHFIWKGDEEGLKKRRFDFFGEMVRWQNPAKPKFEKGLKFYTNKKIIEGDQIYLTEAHFLDKIPATSDCGQVYDPRVLDSSIFLRIIK